MTETTTATTTAREAPLKRCVILGTAPSWAQCPFQDASLEVWGLNDGYLLGPARADRWFDLHPVHQMHFMSRTQGGPGSSGQIPPPPGVYVRPEGHLQWLKTRPMPVYLRETSPAYPTGVTFPQQRVLDFFAPRWPWRLSRRGEIRPGPDYEVSTPAWMLMLAIVEGYREIHVYGIHLATEWEYVQQRPNFEFLLGIASGLGIQLVLPESTPICKAPYRYAFEPKGDLPEQRARAQIATLKQEGAAVRQTLAALPWYARSRKQQLTARAQCLDLEVQDAKSILHRTLSP